MHFEVTCSITKKHFNVLALFRFFIAFRFFISAMEKMSTKTHAGELLKKNVKKVMKSLRELDERDHVLLDEFLIVGGALFILAILLKCANFCLQNFEWMAEKIAPSQSSASFKKKPSMESFLSWAMASRLQNEVNNISLPITYMFLTLL